ncbi:hypothetical protein PQQ86_38620 [Paraburkholderia sediminicola]|uniref:hypothetical protein n=1 Tax=Paraburkholderia sediminicola TaxID=458836 RepID=UPI0038BB41EA
MSIGIKVAHTIMVMYFVKRRRCHTGIAYLGTRFVVDDLRSGRLEAVLVPAAVDDPPIRVPWSDSSKRFPKVRVAW